MTFEEFFSKKKIDLQALQIAEPHLFAEFKEHYQQMGEKSFDHTKKFWFNKLRRLYVLATPAQADQTLGADKIVAQAEILPSPSISQDPAPVNVIAKPAFKPRFTKAPAKTEGPADNAPQDDIANTEIPSSPAKPAFKPRMARPTKPVANAEAINTQPLKDTPPKQEQGVNDDTPVQKGDESTSPQRVAPPAFKPRFVAGANKKANTSETAQAPVDADKTSGETGLTPTPTDPQTPIDNTGIQAEQNTPAPNSTAPARPAFKPRVLAGKGIKKQETADERTKEEEMPGEVRQPSTPPLDPGKTAVNSDKGETKMSFKPRFVKPVSKDNGEGSAGTTDSETGKTAPENKPIENNTAAPLADPATPQSESPGVKPAFKPRFVKTKPADDVEGKNIDNIPTNQITETERDKDKGSPDSTPGTDNTGTMEPTVTKPAFKPRFVKTKSEHTSTQSTEAKPTASDGNAGNDISGDSIIPTPPPQAPAGFKPRLGIKKSGGTPPEEK